MSSATYIMYLQGSRLLYYAQEKKRGLEGNLQNMLNI